MSGEATWFISIPTIILFGILIMTRCSFRILKQSSSGQNTPTMSLFLLDYGKELIGKEKPVDLSPWAGHKIYELHKSQQKSID